MMAAGVEKISGATMGVFEWSETVSSSNEDEGGVFMLRVFTATTFEYKDALFTINLEHLLSQQTLESMFSRLLLSSHVFLEDSNALVLSHGISSILVSDYHFTRHMPNTSRKSKIVIIVNVLISEKEEDSHLEMLGIDHSGILKELEKFCLSSKLITTTHELKAVGLKQIEIGVKVARLIDHDRREEEYDCPICLQGFLTGTLVAMLRCSHVFHDDCLLKWLPKNNSCPLCRSLCATVVHI